MKFLNVIIGVLLGLILSCERTGSRSISAQDSGENEIQDALERWRAPEEIQRNYPYYLSGFDYENRAVWVVEYGKWDLRKIVDKGGKDFQDFDTYTRQAMQRMIRGPPLDKFPGGEKGEGIVLITDANGFTLSQIASPASIRYMLKLAGRLRRVQSNVAYGYFINLNYFAETALNLVRPALGTTMERVEVYGTNAGKWIPQILRRIPRNQLPARYGGVKDFTPVQAYG